MQQPYLMVPHLNRKRLRRIFGKIKRDKDCWMWTGQKTSSGYAVLRWPYDRVAVHRIIYAWLFGPIPNGISKTTPQIDHLCRNRMCVNPAHLEMVTARENNLRGTGMAARHAKRTHCNYGHEYTPENTYVYAAYNGRVCKTCVLARQKRYREEGRRK